jgi:hypothetical protein
MSGRSANGKVKGWHRGWIRLTIDFLNKTPCASKGFLVNRSGPTTRVPMELDRNRRSFSRGGRDPVKAQLLIHVTEYTAPGAQLALICLHGLTDRPNCQRR